MKMNYTLALTTVAGSFLLASSPLRASETDDRIESAAKKSYVYKNYLKDDSITTESKDGVVTLTGTVLVASHKSLAENTVENLPGVSRVDNQLKVAGENPPERSDAWLSTKVKTTLLFHRHVSATATDVFVKDGYVSLRGEAANLAQKELTTEYARDVEGVKGVKNEMTIAKTSAVPAETVGEAIDDASITAQVRAALLSHRSTSAIKTKVSTSEGVVTLSGNAKNAAEKALVTKLTTDVPGVISVINNMTIGTPVAGK